MLTANAQLEWDEAALRIVEDPVFSSWLRLMVERSFQRPTVLAAREAAVLAAVLRGRRNELATGHPLVEPRCTTSGSAGTPSDAVQRRRGTAGAPIIDAAAAVRHARQVVREDPRSRLVVLYLDHARRAIAHSVVEPRPGGFDPALAAPLLQVAEHLAAAGVIVTQVTPARRVRWASEAQPLAKALYEWGAKRGIHLFDYVRFAPGAAHHSLEEDGAG